MTKLPKSWTTVTPLSKYLALLLFIFLPIFTFKLGLIYQHGLDQPFFSSTAPVSSVSVDQAIELVKKRPEVKSWLKLFTNSDGTSPKSGGRPAFTLDHTEGSVYIIHVYESLPDHTSSFNWYRVNPHTGQVTQQF